MGTFTYSPLTDGTLADVQDINTPMAAISTVLNGGIDSTNITPASITPASLSAAANPETRQRRNNVNYVVSGGTIATSATLGSTITAMVAYNNGKEQIVGAFPITVVALKDTYIYEKDDGTYVTTNSVANNAVSPAATTNTDGSTALLVGIVVSSATAITSVNQGSISATAPVVSSATLTVCDTLGNVIYNTNPSGGLIGYRVGLATNLTTAAADAIGTTMVCIIPAGRKVKVTGSARMSQTGGGTNCTVTATVKQDGSLVGAPGMSIILGAAGTTNDITGVALATLAPSAGSHTYVLNGAINSFNVIIGPGAILMVELV